MYKPAEVYFKPGKSAIQIKLTSSIASPASKKALTRKEEIEEETDDISKTSPTEPDDIATKQKTFTKDIAKNEDSLISQNDWVEDKTDLLNKQKKIDTERNIIKEQTLKKLAEEGESEIQNLSLEQSDTESETIPSTERLADLLDKGITAPSISGIKKPKYPFSCRKKGHEGVTVLQATIDKNGRCTAIQIISTAGCPKLDESALKVLKNAKFSPGKSFGVNITSTKKMAFKFKIKDID